MKSEISLRDWCKKVRIALIEEELSIADLAELTGYSSSYIRAVISGRLLRIDTVQSKINEVLNIKE